MSRRFMKLAVESLEDRSLPSSASHHLAEPISTHAAINQAVSNQLLSETIPILQTLNRTLVNTDLDYHGRRGAAIADIGAAETEVVEALIFAHHNLDIDSIPQRTAKGSHPESQQASDAQLSATVPVLKMEIRILESARHDYGGHKDKAIHYLEAAIKQIHEAIAYSHSHNEEQS